MLDFLGHGGPAGRVEAAIARDMAARAEANRAGEPLARTTEQTGDAITALI